MEEERGEVQTSTGEIISLPWHSANKWHSGHWLLAKFYSVTGTHLQETPLLEDVVEQSRILCHDYVIARLKKQGLLTHKVETRLRAISHDKRVTEASHEVQNIGWELERMYSHVYHNVSRQLHVTLHSETIVKKTLAAFGGALYKKDCVITWPKVVSLFAITATFAADCVSQGHAEFVHCVIDTFVDVVREHVAPWVVNQGGWAAICRAFRSHPDKNLLWTCVLFGAIMGLVLVCLLV